MRRALIITAAACGLCGTARAGPETYFRFSNGSNEITVSPGAAVDVSVYARGLPERGTSIPWTTPPGTGQIGHYAGFQASYFSVRAASFGGVTWSNLTVPPPFLGPPFGSPGHQLGKDVVGIAIGVGFNPPVTAQEFLLWRGTVTVGNADVFMDTETGPPKQMPPAYRGFEVGLWGIITLNVAHVLAVSEGYGVIHVPGPGAWSAVLAAGVLARRRRGARTLGSCH